MADLRRWYRRKVRWPLRLLWQGFLTRRFRYRGQLLVGRDLPDVAECHEWKPGHSCPQDDGSHAHEWVQCVVTDRLGGSPASASRCRLCGARKCDMDCTERRHHRGPHHQDDGSLRLVGR